MMTPIRTVTGGQALISIKQMDKVMKQFFAFVIALTAISAVSCQKERELHPVGSKIVFTAATEYKNGLETRTIYSGDYTNTTPNYERIQWTSTDNVEVLYSHGSNSSAKYDIDGSSINGSGTQKKSTANVTPAQGSSALQWAEGGTHKFFGIYPASNVSNGITLSTVTSGGNLYGRVDGLSISNRQTVTWDENKGKYLPDMNKAYMVSYADYSSNPESSVTLPVTPIMSAFEFKLRLPDDRPSYTVSKVQLSASVAIAGTFSVNITGFSDGAVTWDYVAPSPANTSTSVVVTFDKNGSIEPPVPASNSGDVLDFTIFTLPVTISNPVLSVKYHDGTVKQITLTNLTLAAGQKVVISNNKAGHDEFEYDISTPADQECDGHLAHTFANIPVTSTRTSLADNTHTENVTWKVQYWDVNTNWMEGVPTALGFTLSEDHTNNTFSVTFPTNDLWAYDNSISPYDAATEILQSRTPVSSPYDLSMYDVSGNYLGARTTANCYVVTRPGTYRIPCYYGNAVVGGQPNPSAYNPGSVTAISRNWSSGVTDQTQNYYLPQFYNAAGVYITSPNVVDDIIATCGGVGALSAAVTWQDANIIPTTPDVVSEGSDFYIEFTITPENIKPGNVLIELNSSLVGDPWPVIWSWHIWVTEKNLTPEGGIMPYNLGWVDADIPGLDSNDNETATYNTVKRYSDPTLVLRLAQVDDNGNEVNYSDVFTLKQNGELKEVDNPSCGKNPHYQWGRKDPFDESVSTVMLMKHPDGATLYWRGIRVNNVMLEGEKSLTWMDGAAVPLYQQQASSFFAWTIKAGHEIIGPFTTTQKDRLTGSSFNPDGTSWEHAIIQQPTGNWIVTQEYTWSVADAAELIGNGNGSALFTMDDFVSGSSGWEGGIWKLKVNTVIPQATLTEMQNRWNNGQTPCYLPGYINFLLGGGGLTAETTPVPDPDHWQLVYSSFPYGPHNQAVADVLVYNTNNPDGPYFFYGWYNASNDIDPTNLYYTSDAVRSAGSILYNLWNAALYNETASNGKYKSVYDPCPAGFAVPTIESYLGGSWTTQVGNNKEVSGLSPMPSYPQTGARINDIAVATGGNADSPLYSGNPTGFYWTDTPCNMELVNAANMYLIDAYRYHTDSYMLMTTPSSASVSHYNRRAAASIRPMRDPGSGIYPGTSVAPGNVGGSLEGVTTGTDLF